MQIYFISPNGYAQIKTSGVTSNHNWMDVGATQVIGVVEFTKGGEQIASALEAAGIFVLPDHRFGETFANHPNIVTALTPYGVTTTDTTATAMAKVQTKSGFPPHKVKRFQ